MANVTIIGAGLMGTATAWPLSDNGHQVRLVGTHLDSEIIKSCKEQHFHPRLKRDLPCEVKSYYVEEIAEGLEGAEIIVCGVNSLGIHWIGETLSRYVHPGQTIIAITKGLEASPEGTLVILPDVLASELPVRIRDQIKFAAVGGPCIAGELAGRRQTCVVFGSRDRATADKLAGTFGTPYYHIWPTTELVSLEYATALKNAYTLGVGIANGLLEKQNGPDSANAYMHNTAAAIFAQGCSEIEQLLRIVGASSSFAYGLPGAGDLFVTSAGGRTVRLGALFGKGHTFLEARQIMIGETLESVEIVRAMSNVLPNMVQRDLVRPTDLPLMRMLIDIVVHGKVVDLCFDEFFGNMRDA